MLSELIYRNIKGSVILVMVCVFILERVTYEGVELGKEIVSLFRLNFYESKSISSVTLFKMINNMTFYSLLDVWK